jgi:tRNA (guanine37-N1)-methyltransferase
VDYHGMKVPPVLLSGDHKKIDEWRHEAALELTRRQRPDLLPPEPEEAPLEPAGNKKKKQ